MKIIYEGLEPHGFNQLLVADDFVVKPPCTTVAPPMPNFKPKWTGAEWIELATEEETTPSIPTPEPTELDLLKIQNAKLLLEQSEQGKMQQELAQQVAKITIELAEIGKGTEK